MTSFAIALLLSLLATAPAAAVSITACGQSVPDNDTGILAVDLTCPNSASAVFVGETATLDLNGHSISGGGVQCSVTTCTVRGPGEITNVHSFSGNAAAIFINSVPRGGTFIGQDLNLHDNDFGIVSNARRNTLTNVSATDNDGGGIWVFGKATGTNVVVTGNGSDGFRSEFKPIKIDGLTATGNARGVNCAKSRPQLTNSTVTGNSVYDIVSARRPKHVNTTCEHSYWPRREQPWGVCSLD